MNTLSTNPTQTPNLEEVRKEVAEIINNTLEQQDRHIRGNIVLFAENMNHHDNGAISYSVAWQALDTCILAKCKNILDPEAVAMINIY